MALVGLLATRAPAAGGAADEAPQVDVKALIEKARELKVAVDYTAARDFLKKSFDAGVRDRLLAIELAETELFLGLAAPAAARFEVALLWNENDVEIMFWSALAEKAAGRDEKAAALLTKALRAAGDDENRLYEMAEIFLRRGALSLAGVIYERILALYPRESQFDVFASLHLAQYYMLVGKNDKAAEVLKRAKKPMEFGDVDILAPHEADYWIAIFTALGQLESGNLDAGLDRLRDAAARYPIGMAADALVVRELQKAGRSDEAAGAYALVLRRLIAALGNDPEDADAYHSIALLAAISQRDTKAGLGYCQWAMDMKPFTAEYYDTQAALLYSAGRYDKALVSQNRAIDLVTSQRWVEAGAFAPMAWRRLDILEKLGLKPPRAYRRFD